MVGLVDDLTSMAAGLLRAQEPPLSTWVKAYSVSLVNGAYHLRSSEPLPVALGADAIGDIISSMAAQNGLAHFVYYIDGDRYLHMVAYR